MNRPPFTDGVEMSAGLYERIEAHAKATGEAVAAVGDRLINEALDAVGAPWRIHPIVRQLADASATGLYRCTQCGVSGHQASVCMYATDSQRSTSSRAALDYLSGDGSMSDVARQHGLAPSAVGHTIKTVIAARLATLRAMTTAIADGLGGCQ